MLRMSYYNDGKIISNIRFVVVAFGTYSVEELASCAEIETEVEIVRCLFDRGDRLFVDYW
jgi:hypothetical protein